MSLYLSHTLPIILVVVVVVTIQGWTSVIKQTENYMNLVKSNTDQLTSATLEKLQQLIDNKRAQRKLYGEERHRLETDNERVCYAFDCFIWCLDALSGLSTSTFLGAIREVHYIYINTICFH